MLNTSWFFLGLVAIIAAIFVLAGIKKLPGIGFILVVIVLVIIIGSDQLKLSYIGFSSPMSWLATILWSFGLGIGFTLVSYQIFEPANEKMAGQPHNLPILENIRGASRQLLLMISKVLLLASILKDIFSNFLMFELDAQNGTINTTMVGLLLGELFTWSGYTLRMPILINNVIDAIVYI